MSLKLKRKPKSTIPPLEPDTYTATCIGVVDLGEQYNETYKKYEDKILLIFEIDGQTVEQDGEIKPRWLSRELTASVNAKSNLHKYITAFYGQADDSELDEFDMTCLLGEAAFMEVIVKESKSSPGTMYNVINGVTRLPKKTKPPAIESEIMQLDFDDWNEDAFGSLPEWIQDKVRNSPTFQKMFAKPDKVEFTPKSDKQDLPNKADF